jgi:hypothetical protein
MLRRMGKIIYISVAVLLIIGVAYVYYNIKKIEGWELQCNGQSFQLNWALRYYEETHNHFPSAYTIDQEGTKMHSWRALFITNWKEIGDYDFRYDFKEPWNSIHNKRLMDNRFRNTFICPCDYNARRNPHLADYFVVVGDKTLFPGAKTRSYHPKNEESRSNTILMAESNTMNTEWLEPKDLEYDTMSFTINDPTRPSISSGHAQGPHVGMADGSVRSLSNNISPDVLKAMLTVHDDESDVQDPEVKK